MTLSNLTRTHLDRIFCARSVAVIGASDSPERVGYLLLEALLLGGYQGKIYPIHPRHTSLLGCQVYPTLSSLPEVPELALIALNQVKTVDTVRECGQMGVKGAVCVAGGYKEMGAEGMILETQLAAEARKYHMALIGPNTLGFFNANENLNATFYPEEMIAGCGISVVTQSGGVGRAALEELRDEGLGITKWIGAGNRAELEFCDYVDYLADDSATKVIALFIEGTDKGRELMESARRAAMQKPVLVYRTGNSKLAQRSAVTHTGSMIQSAEVFSDACRQFNLIEVQSTNELVCAAKALVLMPPSRGFGLGIITHTAGPSIELLDYLEKCPAELVSFTPKTIEQLEQKFEGVAVILKNPLDAAAFGYSPEGYGDVANDVISDENVNALVAIHALHKNWRFASSQIIEAKERSGKPVLVCYISTVAGVNDLRQELQQAGIPCYTSVQEAGWALSAYFRYMRIRNHA